MASCVLLGINVVILHVGRYTVPSRFKRLLTKYPISESPIWHIRHCCCISYFQTDLEMSDVGEEKQTRSPLPFTPHPPPPIQKPCRFYLLAKSCYPTGHDTNGSFFFFFAFMPINFTKLCNGVRGWQYSLNPVISEKLVASVSSVKQPWTVWPWKRMSS